MNLALLIKIFEVGPIVKIFEDSFHGRHRLFIVYLAIQNITIFERVRFGKR